MRPPVDETAAAQNFVEAERQVRRVHRKLIGVPAEQLVAAVDVERAEDAERLGEHDLVTERVAGEGSVILLDVELDVLGQAVALEEAVTGRDVEVVLMFGRLLGLRLEQNGALEADLVLVLDDEADEAAELVELALHFGVEQGLVAFAAAPQHVVLPTEPVGCFESGAHLASGVGEDIGIGIGRRARHIAAMREQVRCAPEQAHLGLRHLLLEQVGDRIEVGDRLGERIAFRRDVGVMESEERNVEQAEQLEGDIRLLPRRRHRVVHVMPWTHKSLAAEWIVALPTEAVPVANGKAKVILEPAPGDHAVLVVPTERRRRRGVRAAKPYGLSRREKAVRVAHLGSPSLSLRRVETARAYCPA